MQTITDKIFQSHLRCRFKAYLLLSGQSSEKSDYEEMREVLKLNYIKELACKSPAGHEQANSKKHLTDLKIESDFIESRVDAAVRVVGKSNLGEFYYEPVRIIVNKLISKEDEALIGFQGLALGSFQKRMPTYGYFYMGLIQKWRKIKLLSKIEKAQKTIQAIRAISSEPPLYLNRNCRTCEFYEPCRIQAIKEDNLSLLSGITEKDIKKQNDKGIFTIRQYSYTFRSRRKRTKRGARKLFELKALALRENRVYVFERPEFSLGPVQIYLDIEGDPDRDFYYLIGILIVREGCVEQTFSYWADSETEEIAIFEKLLNMIGDISNFNLLHYGSYETKYFKKMNKRTNGKHVVLINAILKNSVNILAVIYSSIYFPTHSNELKDVAGYLGFKWSGGINSGLQCIIFRVQWEICRDEGVKNAIEKYNLEDCFALRKVSEMIFKIILQESVREVAVTYVEDIKDEKRFGKVDFVFPDLEYINNCAYFDYQRDKVYIRTELSSRKKKSIRHRQKYCQINQSTDVPLERHCVYCEKKMSRNGAFWKTQHDLKFTKTGVRRWLVKYRAIRTRCKACGATKIPDAFKKIGKYGHGLISWAIYHNIVNHQTFSKIGHDVEVLFGLQIPRAAFHRLKAIAASFYEDTYTDIFKRLIKGRFVHCDETMVNIKGKREYVWVFTNMDDVVFRHTRTREGEFLKEVFKDFKGVLISDFYAAYDSLECSQQKCLIHLIRDLNEDLRKNPFDEEYRTIVSGFSIQLRAVINTIDNYGLKCRFLRRHKKIIRRYFSKVLQSSYHSELACKYQKRFSKIQDKLFVFMDYDGIPWNNNNAEHAIKHFATYRKTVDGQTTEFGLANYLKLLSIYQSCQYRNINFLSFLLSGEKKLEEFINSKRHHKRYPVHNEKINLDFQKYNWR